MTQMRAPTLRFGVLFRPDAPHDESEYPLTDADEDIYYAPLLGGITDAAKQHGVVITYCYRSPAEWMAYYFAEKLDAVIMVAVGLADPVVVRDMVDAQVPCVAIGTSSSLPSDAELPFIDTENRESGKRVAEYLIQLGHQRMGCVNLTTSYSNHFDRMSGFRIALAAAGLPLEPELMLTHSEYNNEQFEGYVYEWIDHLRRGDRLPSAIFAVDFNMAAATLAALDDHKIKVPGDVSLFGFDDPRMAVTLKPPLTVLRQPLYAMGRRSVDRLVEAFSCDGPRVIGTERFPCEMVIRESTKSFTVPY